MVTHRKQQWQFPAAILLSGGMLTACVVHAYEQLSPKEAQAQAETILQHAQAAKAFQLPWNPAPAEAEGLQVGTQEQLIVVPRATLSDELVDPAAETERGAVLGCLFIAAGYQPLINGSKVETGRLPILRLSGSGMPRETLCLQLAVRRRAKHDWRLYVYGRNRTPLIDTPFESVDPVPSRKLSLQITEEPGQPTQLHIRVLGKYQSSFAIAR